jgi:hypothetical protein
MTVVPLLLLEPLLILFYGLDEISCFFGVDGVVFFSFLCKVIDALVLLRGIGDDSSLKFIETNLIAILFGLHASIFDSLQ